MKIAAYVRVSTDEQTTDSQRQAIEAWCQKEGFTDINWYEDVFTGTTVHRPQLQLLLQEAAAFQKIVVFKFDRLSRSLKDLLTVIDTIGRTGAGLVSIQDSIDLSTPAGKLMMQLIGAFSEFEISLIRQRTKAGLDAARKRGQKLGAPRRVDWGLIENMSSQGYSLRQIARNTGLSASGVRNILQRLQVLHEEKKGA